LQALHGERSCRALASSVSRAVREQARAHAYVLVSGCSCLRSAFSPSSACIKSRRLLSLHPQRFFQRDDKEVPVAVHADGCQAPSRRRVGISRSSAGVLEETEETKVRQLTADPRGRSDSRLLGEIPRARPGVWRG
jgi:hypothetical protein